MKSLPVLILSLALCWTALAQTSAQQSAAKSVFAQFRALNNARKLNTLPARALVVGEAKNYTQHAELGPVSAPDALVFPDAAHAVTRVQGLDENGKPVVDVYFYLVKSGAKWKVSALRTLALTGIIGMARDELERKPKLTPTQRDELANINLTLALDSDLRAHFARHRAAFARLSQIKRRPLSKVEKEQLRHQLAFDPEPTDKMSSMEWIIGGTLDNTVGFVFSPSGQLPPINPNERIWVERLSANWGLFRTT